MSNKFQIPKLRIKNFLAFGIWLLTFIWYLAFGFWHFAFAARLYFEIPEREFRVGEIVPVRILIDTEGEEINAISLKLDYPKNALDLESVNNANSIINFWVDNLAGVVVGGYRGANGLISQLNFKTLAKGAAGIAFSPQSEAHLNDGLGTKARLDLTDRVILTVGGGTAPAPSQLIDSELPEDFTPIIARSPDVFENRYFLVFSAQDKGSGIDHYEVQETRQKIPSPTNWTRSASPHLLINQKLTYYIFVKAVDGAGNERIVGLRPKFEEVSRYPWWLWWLIPLAILLLGITVFAIIRVRRSERRVEK